jgi:hypothetical protein
MTRNTIMRMILMPLVWVSIAIWSGQLSNGWWKSVAYLSRAEYSLPADPNQGAAVIATAAALPLAAFFNQRPAEIKKAAPEPLPGRTVRPPETMPFYVYRDNGAPENRYTPTGRMGDIGDIKIDPDWTDNPQSGTSCIRMQYTAKGMPEHNCDYQGPCKWAGIYWQNPPNNWGLTAAWANTGFNLSNAKRLTFWARAEGAARVDFKVGGIAGKFGDSLEFARMVTAKLTPEWKRFEIDLEGAQLDYIIGGFCWVAEREFNSNGATFYLDEIRFEQ